MNIQGKHLRTLIRKALREQYRSYHHDIGGTFTMDDATDLVRKHGLTMSPRQLWEKHQDSNLHDVDKMIMAWKRRTGRV